MSWGEVTDRWDPDMALYRREVASFKYSTAKLKHLSIGKPQYGANERGVERISEKQPRYVRITDIDGQGRLREGIGVTAESVESKYLLRDGDILFARSGNTVGKAYLHHNIADSCLFAGYMIRFKVKKNLVIPEFVFLCTQLSFYKHWVIATQRATGQPNINAEEYRSLELPIPDLAVQRQFVGTYANNLSIFEERQEKAATLLASIDEFLLAELDISLPPEPENTTASRIFTAKRRELAGWRFDPQALHPVREACIAELQRKPAAKLWKAARFCRDLRTEVPEGAIYVGLENVESNTGRYVPSTDKESVSSAFYFRKGQILFPKLRPYLNKVFLAPFDGLCSTEFHVLEGIALRSDFLTFFLRSQIVVKQTKHLMSGNTLPRLQTEDIEDLLVPIVDPETQERIVSEAGRRINEAEILFKQAEADFDQAKRQIEAMLLGGEV